MRRYIILLLADYYFISRCVEQINGPEGIRTPDRLIKSQALYYPYNNYELIALQAELPAHAPL